MLGDVKFYEQRNLPAVHGEVEHDPPGVRGHLRVKKGDGHRYDQHTHDQQYQADKVPIEPERQWHDKALYYDNSLLNTMQVDQKASGMFIGFQYSTKQRSKPTANIPFIADVPRINLNHRQSF